MFNKHDGGKGDKPILPKDAEQFDKNWDAIFKKPKKDKAQQALEDAVDYVQKGSL
jgi:hypothetical protein